MAIYKYVARDINAKKITGKTEARDEHELSPVFYPQQNALRPIS